MSNDEAILALRIDVADRDRHIEELEATIDRLNIRIRAEDSTSKAFERMWSSSRVRLSNARDLIDNPGGRSSKRIIVRVRAIIGEE